MWNNKTWVENVQLRKDLTWLDFGLKSLVRLIEKKSDRKD